MFISYLKGENEENNPLFAGFTLAFIYLPSLNIIATLYGPRTAGILGIGLSPVMMIVGAILESVSVKTQSHAAVVTDVFLMCLGVVMLNLGIILLAYSRKEPCGQSKNMKKNPLLVIKKQFLSLHSIFFPLLMLFSPFIFLFIKLLGLLKPKNQFIKAQSTTGSRGEAILEAAPQLALQCYVVFLSLSPTSNQWWSIITSTLSLSIPNMEQFITARSHEFGPKSILKNIGVFLPASLFKILAVSILCVFFKWVTVGIIFSYIVVLAPCLVITKWCHNLEEEKEDDQHYIECCFLSWLTITNLGRSKTAALCRLVSSIFCTIAHTITLSMILNICNSDPGNVVIGDELGVTWSDLALVRDLSTLNILLVSTICLGWLSLVLDVILAAVKHHWCGPGDNTEEDEVSFWDGAVLLEGLKYRWRQEQVVINEDKIEEGRRSDSISTISSISNDVRLQPTLVHLDNQAHSESSQPRMPTVDLETLNAIFSVNSA